MKAWSPLPLPRPGAQRIDREHQPRMLPRRIVGDRVGEALPVGLLGEARRVERPPGRLPGSARRTARPCRTCSCVIADFVDQRPPVEARGQLLLEPGPGLPIGRTPEATDGAWLFVEDRRDRRTAELLGPVRRLEAAPHPELHAERLLRIPFVVGADLRQRPVDDIVGADLGARRGLELLPARDHDESPEDAGLGVERFERVDRIAAVADEAIGSHGDESADRPFDLLSVRQVDRQQKQHGAGKQQSAQDERHGRRISPQDRPCAGGARIAPTTAMNTRRALAFIFCTVTLDVLSLGLMIPVLPTIVLGFMDGDTAGAAEIFGVFATVWGLMQFLFSPLLGAMSDRFGRRPIILISCLGLGLDYIFMALAPSLTLLFIGRVISGITAATISTAFAYIADVTKPEARAKAFGLVGVGFGLGFVLGPALGGLLGGIDPRPALLGGRRRALLNAAFGWFVLPESLPPDRRMAFAWKRANPVGSLRLLASHTQLLGLSAVNFLGELAHQVLPTVFVLYAGFRYGWKEETVGLTSGTGRHHCSAIVQGALVGPARSPCSASAAPLIGGLAFGAIGMMIYGLAPTGMLFWAGVPVMALWGLSGPAALGLMSRLVGPSEQGQLQGANNSLASLLLAGRPRNYSR